MPKHNLAFALDFPNLHSAQSLLPRLAPFVGFAKIGLELFTREGPNAVRFAQQHGFDVFLDLKLHDIPETVERAVAAACALGVRLLTIHTSGGPAMIKRAVDRATKESSGLTLLGVTVLTSLDDSDLATIGCAGNASDQVLRLARLGAAAGLDAFVSSPNEVALLRAALGVRPKLVTPGIRPSGAGVQDQKRAATPERAILDGADLLVVGRPIREAADPASAAGSRLAEVDRALAQRPQSA